MYKRNRESLEFKPSCIINSKRLSDIVVELRISIVNNEWIAEEDRVVIYINIKKESISGEPLRISQDILECLRPGSGTPKYLSKQYLGNASQVSVGYHTRREFILKEYKDNSYRIIIDIPLTEEDSNIWSGLNWDSIKNIMNEIEEKRGIQMQSAIIKDSTGVEIENKQNDSKIMGNSGKESIGVLSRCTQNNVRGVNKDTESNKSIFNSNRLDFLLKYKNQMTCTGEQVRLVFEINTGQLNNYTDFKCIISEIVNLLTDIPIEKIPLKMTSTNLETTEIKICTGFLKEFELEFTTGRGEISPTLTLEVINDHKHRSLYPGINFDYI